MKSLNIVWRQQWRISTAKLLMEHTTADTKSVLRSVQQQKNIRIKLVG